jgi:hypothetical protein
VELRSRSGPETLVVSGIYVTVETTLGRDGLLAVARALKPV